MASEVVKIKTAQQIALKKEVEAHTFVFHEGLNQLKSDIGKIWFFGYDDTDVELTDLKKYIELFSETYQLTPQQQSRLEEYNESSDDFKLTLQSLASHLNQSGKTHIILIDEVDLMNVISQEESMEKNNIEVDLSYISEYENVHFVFCFRPAKEGLNNFSISFPNLESNQQFICLGTCYRNTEAILRLIKFFQSQIDDRSEGYSLMGDIPISEMLPPPLIPTGYNSSVVWVPTIPAVEDEAIENLCSLLLSDDMGQLQGKRNPSVAILYNKKKSRALAKKLIHKNPLWSGPHEDVNYNGSEADIIVYISDENMNIQTLARARRCLIILTCDTECNHETILMLQKAVSQKMADIVSSGSYLAGMTKCNKCGSIYCHVQHDQCPAGCDIRINLSQQVTSKNSNFIPFYKRKVVCCMSLLVLIVPILILLLLTTLSQLPCENSNFKGDNFCNDGNNNKGCEWDGGDCCGPNARKDHCTVCACLDPNNATLTPSPTTKRTTTTTTILEIVVGVQRRWPPANPSTRHNYIPNITPTFPPTQTNQNKKQTN